MNDPVLVTTMQLVMVFFAMTMVAPIWFWSVKRRQVVLADPSWRNLESSEDVEVPYQMMFLDVRSKRR